MKPYPLKMPSVKRVAAVSSMVGVVAGIFLAGAMTWPMIQPYAPWTAQQRAMPVKVASIDMTAKRAEHLCAAAIEETARLRKDMADWFKAKTAPKPQPMK